MIKNVNQKGVSWRQTVVSEVQEYTGTFCEVKGNILLYFVCKVP